MISRENNNKIIIILPNWHQIISAKFCWCNFQMYAFKIYKSNCFFIQISLTLGPKTQVDPGMAIVWKWFILVIGKIIDHMLGFRS